MTRISVFMIFLILLSSCSDEKITPLFTEQETVLHNKIIQDFQPPQYKWGYLNKDGNLAVMDKYDDLREYNEGLAAVNINGTWGYIDKLGNEFLPARFLTVSQFSEDRAVVQDLLGRFHIFDIEANLIIDSLEYNSMRKFCSGLSLVEKSRRYGYLDKSGSIAIDLIYEKGNDFVDGLAIVTKDRLSGVIDTQGKVIIPLKYDKIYLPQSGFFRYRKEGKFGYVRQNDKVEAYSGYMSATDFQGAYAVVNNGNNYAMLHRNGEKIILPYSLVDHGGEGKWMYAADARFGFLNNNGSQLCPPQYDLVMRYKEGRAGFAINNAWGYLDEKGQIAIPPKFPLVWDFVDGYARMIDRTGFGYIDKNGEPILPAQYMEVRDFAEGLARIQVYR